MFTFQSFLISVDVWGVFFCLIAIAGIAIGQMVDKKSARLSVALIACLMLLLISDIIMRVSSESTSFRSVPLTHSAAYMTYFFGFMEMPIAAEYITCLIERRSGIRGIMWRYVEWVFFGIGVIMITVNLFTGFLYTVDAEGILRPEALSILPGVVTMMGEIISVGVVLMYLEYLVRFEKAAFIVFLVLPFAAVAFTMIRSDISFVTPAIIISILMLYFSYEFNSREYRIELERDIADRQIRMFYHQIQPHFVFNSLAVIKYQVRTSPETAIDTIDDFSDYLRDSTDLMNTVECVGAERELDLVQHYIGLQKRRFEDIDYRVEISDTDFEIPPFAIQTCVENSITHGLRGQAGKDQFISVRTYKDHGQHVVTVEDNGAGFDVRDLEEKAESGHVGLRNTEERIRLMCGGTFRIESEAGKGTKVTMTIPEQRNSQR